MEYLKHANSFRDLVVYKKAQSIAKTIFAITKNFPKEEMYSPTDQVRRSSRSSRSVGAQIAEAWAKRKYIKHFTSKLTEVGKMLNSMMNKVELFCGNYNYSVKESITEYFTDN